MINQLSVPNFVKLTKMSITSVCDVADVVMFCVLKFYFVDFYGMVSYIFSNMASENACALQSRENIIFQNKTLLVMFYTNELAPLTLYKYKKRSLGRHQGALVALEMHCESSGTIFNDNQPRDLA